MIIAQIPFRLQALSPKTPPLRASFVPFVLLVLSAVFLRVSAVKILSRLPAKPVSSTQSVVEPACLPPRVSHIPRFMPQLHYLKSAVKKILRNPEGCDAGWHRGPATIKPKTMKTTQLPPPFVSVRVNSCLPLSAVFRSRICPQILYLLVPGPGGKIPSKLSLKRFNNSEP